MKISVYVTSYNQKEYLVEAIDSVLAQTLPASQLIIVDDCSSDGSQNIIAGYRARYPELITPLYHAENLGVARSRADALGAVTSDYVTYVDGDDRLLPSKLEKETALLLSRSDVEMAFSNSYYMTEDGRRYFGTWVTKERPSEGNVFCATFGRDFPRGNLYRMELVSFAAWKRVGFHDPDLRLLEDWDMRIRLSKHVRVAYHDEPLSEIRCHRAGLSNLRASEKLSALEYIYAKNQGLLDDVSSREKAHVMRRLDERRAAILRRQAKEELGAYGRHVSNRRRAYELLRESLRYHRTLDLDLALGLVVPTSTYRRLRSAARESLREIRT